MYNKDKKSLNINHLEEFNHIEIPTTKKQVFLDADYSVLINLP